MEYILEKLQQKFNLKLLANPKSLKLSETKMLISGVESETYLLADFNLKQQTKTNILIFDYNFFYEQKTTFLKADFLLKLQQFSIAFIIFTNLPNRILDPLIIEINKLHLTFKTNFTKRELQILIDSYLLKKSLTPQRLHGTLLKVYGEGILITGQSGIGKSELALDLIKRGHIFIADDAIDVINLAGELIAVSPQITQSFMEVRGLGIINVKEMLGIQAISNSSNIDLILELVELEKVKASVDRLGTQQQSLLICNKRVTKIQIPLYQGRDLSSIAETAVVTYKQKKYNNYVAIEDLNLRIKNL